jgi:outer membrane lipopolysaccharide assembly protein LptE/RlpB
MQQERCAGFLKKCVRSCGATLWQLSFGVLMISALSGCGYTLKGGGSVLPQDVKRVYVPMVENSSTETGVATILTEALRDQFERYGVLTVVEDLDEADAVLKARILKISESTRTTTGGNTDTGLQYDTSMRVQAELRRASGPLLWRNPDLSVTKTFGSSKESVVTGSVDFAEGTLSASDLSGLDTREIARGQRGQSLQDLAEQVAQTIYDQAVTPDF